ncbi:type VI secretion system protein TssL [Rhodobacteraceae bacterium CCMM004]|nr:type VI secretion system protein TssL [Rhodobacteraceae bacterium CCMM004]
MSDDDPFAEPEDTDRTVIRPNPGGRRPSLAQPAAAPQAGVQAPADPGPAATASAQVETAVTAGMTGMNPLNAAASTLFSLVSRIRNRAQHPDPDALRRSVVAEVRQFEARALQAGIDPRQVKVARYAICATLDDVVLNTPWGSTSSWAQQSMVATFHRETVGGDRFYDLLARLEQDPANTIDQLEFLYMCLTLGFEGRLRVAQGGAEKHQEIRAGLARIIRAQRGERETELSPRWQGVDKPHKKLSMWKPVWLSVSAVILLLMGGYLGLSYALSNETAEVVGRMAALDPPGPAALERRARPVAVPVLADDEEELRRVAGFLEEEIKEGLVKVFQDANTLTIRIAGSGMFGSASDQLNDRFETPLTRVANALNDTEGAIIIVGHSDSIPTRSSRWQSNLHLSLARAEAVMAFIAPKIAQTGRLRAEGRADKEPIADNATKEGRAQNRRIEVVLIKEESS